MGAIPTGLVWLDDQHYLQVKGGGGGRAAAAGHARGPGAGTEWLVVDAATGQTSAFLDTARSSRRRWPALPGVSAADAKRLAGRSSLLSDQARPNTPMAGNDGGTERVAESVEDRAADARRRRPLPLRHQVLGAGAAHRSRPAFEDDPAFSPDGRLVAFTRDGDLFVVDMATQRERRLTNDGGPQRFNGRLDWVYSGRDLRPRRATARSGGVPTRRGWPSCSSISTRCRRFTLTDHIPRGRRSRCSTIRSPATRTRSVRLGVVRATGGAIPWIDTSKYSAAEHLIVNVGWSPNGQDVVYSLQDREQTWLDLNLGNAATGATRTLFRETTKAWVDNQGDPTWLKDGSFLWTSERSGFKHIYRFDANGTLVKQLTSGPWEARTLYGVDEKNGWVYFAGTERSPIGSDVYRVKLDGTGFARLTQKAGSNSANFNPSHDRLDRHVERRHDADADATAQGRRLRGSPDRREQGCRCWPSTACRSRSSCR